MLQRLALVVWWLGSIVWGLTALGCCYVQVRQLIEQHRCAPIFAEYENWQRKYDDSLATYEADHKKATTGQTATATSDNAATDKAGAAALAELEEEDVLIGVVPKRVGLDDDYGRCRVVVDRTYWFALLAASIFTLLAFSMAFVFGSRFWLPPKIRER